MYISDAEKNRRAEKANVRFVRSKAAIRDAYGKLDEKAGRRGSAKKAARKMPKSLSR
jgi:hypothetical protein